MSAISARLKLKTQFYSKLPPFLILGLFLIVLPIFLPIDIQGIMTKFLIYAIFAISYDLIFGYTGLVSLGHAAFFGAGGYVVASLSLRFGISSFWIGMPLALIVSTLVAVVFGFISLRVSGTYFLLLTFALAQLLYSVAWNTPWLNSEGMQGIANISLPSLGIPGHTWTNATFYFFVLLNAIICYYILRRITRSPFGHALVGIREGEAHMTALGYDIWGFKYRAYILAAPFAGLAGALFAYFNRFISPSQFGLATSFYPMVMAIIGGSGVLYGAVVGAAVIVFIEYFASLITPERWPLILGLIFVLSIMYLRTGLGVSLFRFWQKVSRKNGYLRVENISKQFDGVDVLLNISFSVHPGERLLIIGPNGAGKTTLFNIISGQLPPTSGKIFFMDQDITHEPAHKRAHLGIVQSCQILSLLSNLTVMDNALLTFHGCNKSRLNIFKDWLSYRDVVEGASETLKMADLWEQRNEPVKLLSYGDQRRLEVMMSIFLEPKILLLDEPTNGLTNEESKAIVKLIQKLGKDVTVLVVAHDMDFVFEVAERINVLYCGGLLASGWPDEIRNNPKVREIYMGDEGL
jgi:branched-chain amino acid transport system permease protein